jgi:hypothetical protein
MISLKNASNTPHMMAVIDGIVIVKNMMASMTSK